MTTPAVQAPNRIWLLLNEGDQGEHVWCDCPDPDNSEKVAVEYIRAVTILSPDADKARIAEPRDLVESAETWASRAVQAQAERDAARAEIVKLEAEVSDLLYYRKAVSDFVRDHWPADQDLSGADSVFGAVGWMVEERKRVTAAETAFAQITAERDRLREALEEIAHSELIGWVKNCAEDALAALDTEGGK